VIAYGGVRGWVSIQPLNEAPARNRFGLRFAPQGFQYFYCASYCTV